MFASSQLLQWQLEVNNLNETQWSHVFGKCLFSLCGLVQSSQYIASVRRAVDMHLVLLVRSPGVARSHCTLNLPC